MTGIGVGVGGVEKKGREGLQESIGKLFGVDSYNQYLDYGDGFTNVYVYETKPVVYFKSIASYISTKSQ